MMVKGNSDLDQALKEPLSLRRGSPPDVFQYLVGVEEPPLVK
jgi:hypothetical protein